MGKATGKATGKRKVRLFNRHIDEQSFVGRHHSGYCKGKPCFINVLELQKGNNTMNNTNLYFQMAFEKATH